VKFDAVLFDCDGVLLDSEGITNGVLRDMLEERGWSMTLQQCMDLFIGNSMADKRSVIEARTGLPLTKDWILAFRVRRNAALVADIQAIPHIHAVVAAVHLATLGRIACQ
jgi:beta-phosphoglucomutase-like phosphatase (HAD superfamily)